jgi:signal transduction histidine kinase
MKSQHEPIEIVVNIPELNTSFKNYIYYKDSSLLTQLRYYPYFQLAVIALFLLVSYFAFSTSRKAEQNQVWVGMAKETAHQLGTPISSLIAWVEYLKLKGLEPEMTNEVEKDILRLSTITERFSKIGSTPKLNTENVADVVKQTMDYIQSRSSDRVQFSFNSPKDKTLTAQLNVPLFEWVIENICKNAIDAMGGEGSIAVSISEAQHGIFIDIKDSGKGISKSKFNTIFNPGYTTKSRGWGLGLSLAKRIINEYHKGNIFVKESEYNKGTIFRIMLK